MEYGAELRVLFGKNSFDPAKKYYILFVIKHRGTESWPRVCQGISFGSGDALAATMDALVVAQAVQSASAPGRAIHSFPFSAGT